ncbi:hypothetical protein Tco_0798048 [Tanacetum coccineum]
MITTTITTLTIATTTTIKITATITIATTITNNNKIEGRKPLGRIETVDIIDLIPCVGTVHCITHDLALSGVRNSNKLILDLANIDIEIEDEDQALMLLTSLPLSYEDFMETLLYGKESLTMEDVLETLNSRELKKRTEGTTEENGGGLYVRGRGSSEEYCLRKKSSRFAKKGKRNEDSDSSDNEGNAYFGEALVVVGTNEMTELIMNLGDKGTCTIKGTRKLKKQLHDGSSFMLKDVRYVLGSRRSLISLGTLEKEGYTVKMQMGRIKMIKGCQVMMTRDQAKELFGFKQLGDKQVRFKQLGPEVKTRVHGVHVNEQVWFEVELQGAQGNREAEVFQVSNDDTAVAQRQLKEKQLEEKTNTDCLVKEHEKVHLGIKVRAQIMVTEVPDQEDAEGNIAE